MTLLTIQGDVFSPAAVNGLVKLVEHFPLPPVQVGDTAYHGRCFFSYKLTIYFNGSESKTYSWREEAERDAAMAEALDAWRSSLTPPSSPRPLEGVQGGGSGSGGPVVEVEKVREWWRQQRARAWLLPIDTNALWFESVFDILDASLLAFIRESHR